MKRKVFGANVDVAEVISRRLLHCDHCEHETPTCRKLYVKAGTTRTVCVELA